MLRGKPSHITSIRLEEEDFKTLEEMSIYLDRTVSDLIRKAVKTYIKVYNEKQSKKNERK